jgi:hypothetical protein
MVHGEHIVDICTQRRRPERDTICWRYWRLCLLRSTIYASATECDNRHRIRIRMSFVSFQRSLWLFLQFYFVAQMIMYTLGFYHEHMRYDRNTYVTVQSAHISAGEDTTANFGLMEPNQVTTFGLPYEYGMRQVYYAKDHLLLSNCYNIMLLSMLQVVLHTIRRMNSPSTQVYTHCIRPMLTICIRSVVRML